MKYEQALVLWWCVGTLSAQTLSFLPPVDAYVSGYYRDATMISASIATADFNGDGKIDIAYAVPELTPVLGVVLGNGDGTFRPGAMFPPAVAPARVRAADFNGDGKPDVAFSGNGATVIFLGDGAGSFGTQITVSACSGISVVADVNGDGKQDLICGTSVLLSNGDGTFRAGATLDGLAVLTADFNRDGKADILLIAGATQLAVVLGRGDGTFGLDMPVSNPSFLQTIQAADFNNDGFLDLVGTSGDGTRIVVLPGHGDGSFGAGIVSPGTLSPITAVADFNHDGNQDLVAGDAVLAGNGDGTFRFPLFVGVVTQACEPPTVDEGAGDPCSYDHLATAVADFNNDGSPDIAAGYIAFGVDVTTVNTVSVLLNDSPGDGFSTTGISPATWSLPVTSGSIVAAFGSDLAPQTATATTNPAPTTLGGIRLHIKDRSHTGDMLAPLYYVSATQINYLLTSTDPYAWVSIERLGSPYVPKGLSIPIGPLVNTVPPTLFSLGNGLAAASAVSVAPDGTQTQVPVTTCTGSTCGSVPINVSGNPVYLSLYGTGIFTGCYVDGLQVPLTYSGPQGQTPDLDQVNVLLPGILAGAGMSPVGCAGSNVVMVAIQ
jgi:uncharacterized protein (TIGR03437 family)